MPEAGKAGGFPIEPVCVICRQGPAVVHSPRRRSFVIRVSVLPDGFSPPAAAGWSFVVVFVVPWLFVAENPSLAPPHLPLLVLV